MTSVISLRLPAVLERAIRETAVYAKRTLPNLIGPILEHSIGGKYDFLALNDAPQPLDAKLDVRLPQQLATRLRAESLRLNISISVYSRVILYAYFTRRLVFLQVEGRYTLAENHEQKKSA